MLDLASASAPRTLTFAPRSSIAELRSAPKGSAGRLHAALTDWRLKREPGVPREVDPGILRHLGDEGIDERTPHRLGVDGGEMRSRQQSPHHLPGPARVNEIVYNQHPASLPVPACKDALRDPFEHFEFALLGGIAITLDADCLDDSQVEFTCHNGGRDKATACDANDRVKRTRIGQ